MRSTAGTVTEPSAFWQFSRIAISVRPSARPEPFNVCSGSVLPFSFLKRACECYGVVSREYARLGFAA